MKVKPYGKCRLKVFENEPHPHMRRFGSALCHIRMGNLGEAKKLVDEMINAADAVAYQIAAPFRSIIRTELKSPAILEGVRLKP